MKKNKEEKIKLELTTGELLIICVLATEAVLEKKSIREGKYFTGLLVKLVKMLDEQNEKYKNKLLNNKDESNTNGVKEL
jgi:hypothetical protein